MPFRTSCRIARRAIRMAPLAARVAVLLALGGAVAGCTTDGIDGASGAYARMGNMPTVTFESVDGPPPQVFDHLVSILDSEAKLRHVAVVSRDAPAAYRVRTYLAAQIRGGRTSIAWVWDVYDRNQQRALRLSGEEPAGKPGSDAWAAADDVVLRRIAQAGLSGLSPVLDGSAPAETAPAAPGNGPAIASSGEPGPVNPGGGSALSFASR